VSFLYKHFWDRLIKELNSDKLGMYAKHLTEYSSNSNYHKTRKRIPFEYSMIYGENE